MVSEEQARALLECCEQRLGRLDSLRSSLLGNKPKEALWELIVLYACIDAAPIVRYEPGPSQPDVLLLDESENHLLSVEATFVHSNTTKKCELFREFQRYLYKDIVKYVPSIKGVSINLDCLSSYQKDVCLPPPHTWKSLLDDVGDSSRYSELLVCQKQVIELPKADLVITLAVQDREGVTGGYKVPGLPAVFSDHVCYKTVKRKGRQAKKWSSSIRDKPILIIIGADDVSSEFDLSGVIHSVGLRNAIYGALLDTTKMDPLDRVNLLNDWRQKAIKLNVSGSNLISGVLMVHLSESEGGWYYPGPGRKSPKLNFFKNKDADYPISGNVIEIVNAINFNNIVYGPGWESWSQDFNEGHVKRYKYEGGSMSVGDDGNGNMVFEIPKVVLLRVLAGDADIDELYPHNGQGSFEGMFKRALNEGREILDISLKKGNTLKREADKAVITIGPIVDKVLKLPKHYR